MQGEIGTATQPELDEETRQFIRRCLSANLVEIDDLKKVVVSLMAEDIRFTPERLAEGLVGANILTGWQSSKLLAGKSRGFYLGSYRLLRPLGKGGMGVVYLGEHGVMKKLMALKILPPEATQDQRRINRFKEEARACAQLEHPNIVNAYDFSEAGGKLYIVMEYVDGIDLQQAVMRDGVMSIADAMDVLTQATAGLAHAHERGIIHRDIKPSNLLMRSDGVVKLSDLGLARVGWSNMDEGDPQKRTLTGTVDFCAPEQAINSKTVDARADIYSLACTLYFLLTGRPPFAGETVAKRLAKHQTAPVPDIRQHRSDCPAAVAELAMKMMAKRPEDRPKSAVELLAQLKRLTSNSNLGDRGRLRQVALTSDTAVDEEVYEATLDDSFSSDPETPVEVVDDFDFGNLPPADSETASVDPLGPGLPAASPASVPKPKPPAKPQAKKQAGSQAGQQQLLLGIGLAVAVIALLIVGFMGYKTMTQPLPQATPKVKTVESDRGEVIIVNQ